MLTKAFKSHFKVRKLEGTDFKLNIKIKHLSRNRWG